MIADVRPTIEEQAKRIARDLDELGSTGGDQAKLVSLAHRIGNLSCASRLLEGRRRAAKRGLKTSGPVPYGYRRGNGGKLEVVEHEAIVVRWLFKTYLSNGETVASVVNELAADRIRTRSGKRWSRAGVAWVLKNKTYIGQITYGDVRAHGKHVPLIAAIVFNKVGVKMRKQRRRRPSVGKGTP